MLLWTVLMKMRGVKSHFETCSKCWICRCCCRGQGSSRWPYRVWMRKRVKARMRVRYEEKREGERVRKRGRGWEREDERVRWGWGWKGDMGQGRQDKSEDEGVDEEEREKVRERGRGWEREMRVGWEDKGEKWRGEIKKIEWIERTRVGMKNKNKRVKMKERIKWTQTKTS